MLSPAAGQITQPDREKAYPATLEPADERSDLAVLQVKADTYPRLQWEIPVARQTGETVVAIGNPWGVSSPGQ